MTPRRLLVGLLTGLGLLAAAGWGVFFLAQPHAEPVAPTEPVEPVTRLAPGRPIEARIALEQARTYPLDHDGSPFLEITVEQRGIDLTVTLRDAAGQPLIVVDDASLGEKGIESLPALVDGAGAYKVEIKPKNDYGNPGRYFIRLDVRQPSERDRLRALAAQDLTRAGALEETESPGEALPFLDRAIAYAERAQDPYQIADALYRKGLVLVAALRYEEARDALRLAGERYLDLGNPLGQANALNQEGTVLYHLNDLEGALRNRERALDLYKRVAGPVGDLGQANTYKYMAVTYYAWGEYRSAADSYRQSLAIWPPGADERGRIQIGVYLGILYMTLADYVQARHKFEDALDQLAPLGLDADLACTKVRALGGLGQTYTLNGQSRKALHYYERALGLSKLCDDAGAFAPIANQIGEIYLNRPAKGLNRYMAQFAFQRAYRLSREAKEKFSEMNALTGLARLRVLNGDLETGRGLFDEALAARRASGYRLGIAGALYGRAQTEQAIGDIEAAQLSVAEALEVIEDLRREPDADTLSASLFASRRQNYDLAVSLWMEQHERDPDAGSEARAFEVSEMARGRTLLDSLSSEQSADNEASEVPGVEKKLLQDLRTSWRRRVQLNRSLGENPTEEGKRQIEALDGAIKDLLVELERIRPRVLDLEASEPLTLPEIQEQVLDDQTLLLAYWFGKTGEDSYLWAVDQTSITVHPFAPGAKATIERLVRRANAGLSNRNYTDSSTPQDLSNLSALVLAPVASRLEGRRLLIVADGELQTIPFPVLQDPRFLLTGPPQKGQKDWDRYRPLIDRHTVVMLPSASMLGLLRRETAARPEPPKEIAVIADPVFQLEDERFERVEAQSEERSAVLDSELENLDRLPWTGLEAEAILALVDPEESFRAIGFDANLDTVRNEELKQYKIVHFATHGIVDSLPEFSGLALSAVRENRLPRSSFLRAFEISRMELPVELVVLSACETGLGKTVAGEGVFNLSRAFFYAGAERVVVTHWKVNDRATSEFMKILYEKILKEKLEHSEALRAAQREMLQKPQWAHPYYWGGFVLQGEW